MGQVLLQDIEHSMPALILASRGMGTCGIADGHVAHCHFRRGRVARNGEMLLRGRIGASCRRFPTAKLAFNDPPDGASVIVWRGGAGIMQCDFVLLLGGCSEVAARSPYALVPWKLGVGDPPPFPRPLPSPLPPLIDAAAALRLFEGLSVWPLPMPAGSRRWCCCVCSLSGVVSSSVGASPNQGGKARFARWGLRAWIRTNMCPMGMARRQASRRGAPGLARPGNSDVP